MALTPNHTSHSELRESLAVAIEDVLLMDSPEGDSPRNIAANLREVLGGLNELLEQLNNTLARAESNGENWRLEVKRRMALEEQLEALPSTEDVEKRVAWWINDFHFKAPEQLTGGYWKMMAREIAEYARGSE